MANIDAELQKILDATYGEEVRMSIHDAIKKGNEEIDIAVENERNRIITEKQRLKAEELRFNAESIRVTKENRRIEAESDRVSAETTRAVNERTRTYSENQRATAEQSRIEAEKQRVSAESHRETLEGDRTSGEKIRVESERKRVLAEISRVDAEKLRVIAENLRGTRLNALENITSNRQWHLISDITLTESTSSIHIIGNSGRPLSLNEVKIILEIVSDNNTNSSYAMTMLINQSTVYIDQTGMLSSSTIQSGATRVYNFNMSYNDGIAANDITRILRPKTGYSTRSMPNFYRQPLLETNSTIDIIEFVASVAKFGIGTKIKVWGR